MAYEYTDRFFDLFHDHNVSRNRVTFALKAFRLIRSGAAIYVDLFRRIARSKQTRKAEISCRVKTRSMSKDVRRCENDAHKASMSSYEKITIK